MYVIVTDAAAQHLQVLLTQYLQLQLTRADLELPLPLHPSLLQNECQTPDSPCVTCCIFWKLAVVAADLDRFLVQISGTDGPTGVKVAGADVDATPNTVWNAARLQTGMTEILVAPGLRTPRDEARPSPLSCVHEDEGAAGDIGNGPHAQTLELHLEADSKAAANESDPHVPSEAEKDEATPGTGLESKTSSPLEEEEGMTADADEDDLDAQSIISDGADSYQGLPPETLAHLAASANKITSIGSEQAEQRAAAAGQSGAPDTACEQDMQEDEQQVPQEPLKPGTAARTEADGEAEQEDSHMPEERLQLGDSVREAGDLNEVQMAVDGLSEEAAGSPHHSAAAEALSSSEVVKWQAGAGIEVHCCNAPQLWSWQAGILSDSFSSEATQAMVRWQSIPSAGALHAPIPHLLELVEVARLRPVPPTQMHVGETDMPPRGCVLEVDCGHGGGHKCAVLIARRRMYLGEQQDLDSMVHAIPPGTSTAALCCRWLCYISVAKVGIGLAVTISQGTWHPPLFVCVCLGVSSTVGNETSMMFSLDDLADSVLCVSCY